MPQFCRMIAPKWLLETNTSLKKVVEGDFTDEEIKQHNEAGYNIYYWPNSPSELPESGPVNGTHIDQWNYLFVDYDSKSNTYSCKDSFISRVLDSNITPSKIVDSGNGVHVYWKISDLDPMSYLRLQRRLVRFYNTDAATCSIMQLMRLPNTYNTKDPNKNLRCEILAEMKFSYTCEEIDKKLPSITVEDEEFCQQHYNKTYNVNREDLTIDETIPPKFGKLLNSSHEAKDLWAGSTSDRSKNDYRLGHLMFANGFTKDEAASVLVNSAKALQRAPVHRASYAQNIIDKIWTYEQEPAKEGPKLSSSVKDILKKQGNALKGTPFRCHKRIDNTECGFKLGHVIGLVAGAGVGKTAFSLNMFRWFIEENPDYHHFFIPLEQTSNEIAERWSVMSGTDTSLNDKVHVLSNYDDDGNFRHLSFDEIKTYIQDWQKTTGNKVGCIVIDHIGALKKKGSNDENQDLMTICHSMKAFAIQTNTLLVMQSQTSREKAGIGDLELNKDAAYGTMFFEAYCDWLITIWQPVKRCHNEQACPTVTAFKYCKIRHKKAKKDVIQEDVCYYFYFDSDTEQFRDMTQDEMTSFKYFLPRATNKRKADRKTELVEYKSVDYKEGGPVATPVEHNTDSRRH